MTDEKERECREAFEEWMVNDLGYLQRQFKLNQSGEYQWILIQKDWIVWQAAWNRRAPAEQSDFVMMPKTLTADNGAKAALSGEFFEAVEHGCVDCLGAIYKKAVELLALPAPPKEER